MDAQKIGAITAKLGLDLSAEEFEAVAAKAQELVDAAGDDGVPGPTSAIARSTMPSPAPAAAPSRSRRRASRLPSPSVARSARDTSLSRRRSRTTSARAWSATPSS